MHVIPRKPPPERTAGRAKNAVALFSHVEVGNVERRTILILHAVVIQVRTLTQRKFGQ